MVKALASFIFIFLFSTAAAFTQTSGPAAKMSKPGVKEVQVPFASLKPTAVFKIGGTADWVLITQDAVWVAGTKPYAVHRIDPATNKMVASISVPGEPCSGLALGFGSIWVPICGKNSGLVRINAATNTVSATLPVAPAGPEGGIAASDESVWMVTDKKGTLSRINPETNSVSQRISIPPGSYNPLFSNRVIWVTGNETNVLTAVDAIAGKILDTVTVGPKPRFLTVGSSSIWTLNQGDGTISRVDEKSRKVNATIQAGIPGSGGDITYGADSVWTTVFDVPLTCIDRSTNKVAKQWVGKGGDSVSFGFDSIWLTDYRKGSLARLPIWSLFK